MSNETEDLNYAISLVQPVVLDYFVSFELFAQKNRDCDFEDISDDIINIMKKFSPWINTIVRDAFNDDEKYQDFSLDDYLDARLAEDEYYMYESTEHPRYIITFADRIKSPEDSKTTVYLKRTYPLVDIFWGELGSEKLKYSPLISPREHIDEAWKDIGESLVRGVSLLRYDQSQGTGSYYKFGSVATRLRDLNEFNKACRKATDDEKGIFEVYPSLPHEIDSKRINNSRPRIMYIPKEMA